MKIDLGSDKYDLLQVITMIRKHKPAVAAEIVAHILVESQKLCALPDYKRGLVVLADVDDTFTMDIVPIVKKPMSGAGGQKYPRPCVVPGFLPLARAMGEGRIVFISGNIYFYFRLITDTDYDSFPVTTFFRVSLPPLSSPLLSPLPSLSPLSLPHKHSHTRASLMYLSPSARPEMLENKTLNDFKHKYGLENATLLTGNAAETLLMGITKSKDSIAAVGKTKLANFNRYTELYPEKDFVWIGGAFLVS